MPEARRLKALEDEIRRLKKLLTEAVLDLAAAEGSSGKTELAAVQRVAALRLMAECGLSQRHVCGLLGVVPNMVRRREHRGDKAVGARLRALPASGAASVTGGSASCL